MNRITNHNLSFFERSLLNAPVIWKTEVRKKRKAGLPKAKAMGTKGFLPFEDAMEEAMACYAPGISPKEKKKQQEDIIRYFLTQFISPSEYYLFSFDKMNKRRSQKRQFVSRVEKDRAMTKALGKGEKYKLLHDKYECYKRLKEFYKRDACKLTADSTEEFLRFCKMHSSFMAKPLSGGGGGTTFVMHTEGLREDQIKERIESLLSKSSEWMIEELIEQDKQMAQWNSSSVNTVRVCSRINSSGFGVFDAVFRMGRKGSDVDNASSGGVAALVDVKTGKVTSDAIDKKNNVYTEHPDSHLPIKGFDVPKWDELLETVKKVHTQIAPYPYVGWDFALSDKGWVIVEGNWGHLISQEIRKKGIRKEFYKSFR